MSNRLPNRYFSENFRWVPLRTAGPNGADTKTPKHKSVTASDATNKLEIVFLRQFSDITRRVIKFPTNVNEEIIPNETDSRIILALPLDCNSTNISASCFLVEFITHRVNRIQLWS